VSHIADGEEITLIWSINHWTDDERNSILMYQLTVELQPINQRRRRDVQSQIWVQYKIQEKYYST